MTCSITQSCPTLCYAADRSPSGSSVHGISQARILAWVAISFSRGIFPAQGLNPHLLHWFTSADLLLNHLRSPYQRLRGEGNGQMSVKRHKLPAMQYTNSGNLIHSLLNVPNISVLYTGQLLREYIWNVLTTKKKKVIMWWDRGIS